MRRLYQIAYPDLEGSSNIRIGIQRPRTGEQLAWQERVYGFVFPPNTPVQVLVFSGDGKWHPQSAVASVDQFEWTDNCYFGNKNGGYGPHRICAIAGVPSI